MRSKHGKKDKEAARARTGAAKTRWQLGEIGKKSSRQAATKEEMAEEKIEVAQKLAPLLSAQPFSYLPTTAWNYRNAISTRRAIRGPRGGVEEGGE